jgi:hypothetical protein
MMVGIVNPSRSEDPWGRWSSPPHGGAVIASTDPTLGGSTLKHEGRRQTDHRSLYAGSRLKPIDDSGRSRLTSQPSSRNGENPPCGMSGGTMETAASFEFRNAPSSYPTDAVGHRARHVGVSEVVHVDGIGCPLRPPRAANSEWNKTHQRASSPTAMSPATYAQAVR